MYLDPSILLVFGIHVRPHARKKPKQHTNPPRWLEKINESLHSQRNLVQKENKQKKAQNLNLQTEFSETQKSIAKDLVCFLFTKIWSHVSSLTEGTMEVVNSIPLLLQTRFCRNAGFKMIGEQKFRFAEVCWRVCLGDLHKREKRIWSNQKQDRRNWKQQKKWSRFWRWRQWRSWKKCARNMVW